MRPARNRKLLGLAPITGSLVSYAGSSLANFAWLALPPLIADRRRREANPPGRAALALEAA